MQQPNQKLDKGQKFMIKPLNVEPKRTRPSFQMNGVTKYNFMVKAELKDGTETIFEYASPTQDASDVFVLHLWQWVVCMQPSDIACNIQPCEPPGEERTKIADARKLVDDAMGKMNTQPNSFFEAPKSTRNFNQDYNSKEWGFVYAWAKDIVVAEMSMGTIFSQGCDDPNPVQRISYYARLIHAEMIKDIAGN